MTFELPIIWSGDLVVVTLIDGSKLRGIFHFKPDDDGGAWYLNPPKDTQLDPEIASVESTTILNADHILYATEGIAVTERVARHVLRAPVDGWDQVAQDHFNSLTDADAAKLLRDYAEVTIANTRAHLLAAARRIEQRGGGDGSP